MWHMKALLPILLIIAAATQSLLAQTTTLTFPDMGSGPERQQNIPVLAGEVFELLTWFSSNAGMTDLLVDGIQISTSSFANNPQKIIVAGPKTVSVKVPLNLTLVCTYKLTTVSTVATQNVASQAVVIPENAPAPVDVILESSTDLTNWTAAVAGSYSPATSKRFFRVRLVAH